MFFYINNIIRILVTVRAVTKSVIQVNDFTWDVKHMLLVYDLLNSECLKLLTEQASYFTVCTFQAMLSQAMLACTLATKAQFACIMARNAQLACTLGTPGHASFCDPDSGSGSEMLL